MNRQIRNDRVDDLFERALPVIHSAFENHYRLSEQEAREAEKNLSMWFHRFVRRTGLSQTSARAGELAIRVALGASRGRLVRQFLAEALLPSLLGGCLGGRRGRVVPLKKNRGNL